MLTASYRLGSAAKRSSWITLSQAVTDPVLACPGMIEEGTIADVQNLVLPAGLLLSAVGAARGGSVALVYNGAASRAEAIATELGRMTAGLRARDNLTAPQKSEICSLVRMAVEGAGENPDSVTVRAAQNSLDSVVDTFLSRGAPVLAVNKPSLRTRDIVLGVGLLAGATVLGMYSYRRWQARH